MCAFSPWSIPTHSNAWQEQHENWVSRQGQDVAFLLHIQWTDSFPFSLSNDCVCQADTNNRTLYFRNLSISAYIKWNKVMPTWRFSEAKHFSPGKKKKNVVRHYMFPQLPSSLLDLPSCWCYILCYQDNLFIKVLVSVTENKWHMIYLGCITKVNARIEQEAKEDSPFWTLTSIMKKIWAYRTVTRTQELPQSKSFAMKTTNILNFFPPFKLCNLLWCHTVSGI